MRCGSGSRTSRGRAMPGSRRRRARGPSARSFDWRQMAAAAVVAASLASVGTYVGLQQTASNGEIAEIVAGHQRALLATVAFRRCVERPAHGQAVVRRQARCLATDRRPCRSGLPARRRSRRRRRRTPRADRRLQAPRARDQPDRGAEAGQQGRRRTAHAYDARRLFAAVWPGRDFTYAAVSDVAAGELEEFVARWRGGATAK